MDDKQYALAKQGIKIGVIAICAITAIVVGKRIVKRIRNASETKALDNIANNTTEKANITTAQASVIAQGFYNAMEGMGTDENAIRTLASQLKNATDWALVIKAFGYKDYGTFGAPMYSWLPSASTNLMGWLRNEVSGTLMQQLEQTWAQLGIVG